MKKVIQLNIVLLLFIPFFFSCTKEKSEDVNQNKIYAEYELFYDKNQDKTYASAIFKFSNNLGTQLQLSAPSEVKFGNDIIPFDPVFAYYRKEYTGFVNSGNFTFKDTNGLIYTNTVSVAKPIENPTITNLPRTGAFTYTWTGDALQTNEAIGLTIGSVANPGNFQFFYQNTVNSTSLTLALTQLNQLAVGSSYTQLDRQIETNATGVTSAGGKIRGKYRGLNKTVNVQ